jgi:hypothetical protein
VIIHLINPAPGAEVPSFRVGDLVVIEHEGAELDGTQALVVYAPDKSGWVTTAICGGEILQVRRCILRKVGSVFDLAWPEPDRKEEGR